MSDGFNLRLRRPRPSVVACSPTLEALGAVNLMPAYFAEEDALEARIARSSRRRRAVSVLLRWLTYAAATVTAAVLLFVVGYILVRGVPALTPDLFQWEYTHRDNLLAWLMTFRDQVTLLEPAAMRQEIIDACRRMLRAYEAMEHSTDT